MWQDYIYLILDRIRITIHVLKKSDFCRNPNTVSISFLEWLSVLMCLLGGRRNFDKFKRAAIKVTKLRKWSD